MFIFTVSSTIIIRVIKMIKHVTRENLLVFYLVSVTIIRLQYRSGFALSQNLKTRKHFMSRIRKHKY